MQIIDRVRVLARIPKLVVQNFFLGVAKYMRGHGRTKSVLGR